MRLKPYHKIQTLFKRDEQTNKIIWNSWTLPEFKYLSENEWIFDEKVDGTNIRVMWDGMKATYGGRTDNAQMSVPLLTRLQELFDNPNLWESAFGSGEMQVCLYGEGYGKKIQKMGHLYSDSQDFVLFDVNISGTWLEREQVEDVASNMGVALTPVLGEGTLYEAVEMVEEGFNSRWGDFFAEGIVARPKVRLLDKRGSRIITKIKHSDFAI